jgi:hypothetical protein
MEKMHNLKNPQVLVSIMFLFVLSCGQITPIAPTLTLIPASNSTNTVISTQVITSTDGRHVELEGGFSYIPPVGWQVVEFPGEKYKIVAGKASTDSYLILTFSDETYAGSLDNYVAGNLNGLKSAYKSVNIINQENFKTDNGESAIKIIAENKINGEQLHQTYYIFADNDRKFIITYTRLQGSDEDNDVLIDQCIKTFQVDK